MNRLVQLVSRLKGRTTQVAKESRTAQPDYESRMESEVKNYADCINVNDLPRIFHYWSNKYLLPMFQPFGFSSPNDFFHKYVLDRFESAPGKSKRFLSIGSGNGELEVGIAKELTDTGHVDFTIECIEINRNMIERATELAEKANVRSRVIFLQEDFNTWIPAEKTYDIIIANQSLHHVLDLEHLFNSIELGLKSDGLFLNSDIIGRNGHQRWPEALEFVNDFWRELPDEYRYNQQIGRQEPAYINHDCSGESFEGIRAQDILPLLVERFSFELFIPYGNIVFVFVDRAFGHNFDPDADWDRDFIDRVHQTDEARFLKGDLKPTSMLAAMTLKHAQTKLRHSQLTPEFCIRDPDK